MTPIEFAKLLRRPWSLRGGDYMLRINLTPTYRWYRRHLPTVFLHHFFRGDRDDELHNHDWPWGISFVLSGGYTAEEADGRLGAIREAFYRPGRTNIFFKDTFHRLTLHDPKNGCWTICVVGPKADETETWGFVKKDTREFELAKDKFAREKREAAAALCWCSDFKSAGVPCPPGTCPSGPKQESA